MAHTVRTLTTSPRERHPFYEIQEIRSRILARAEREEWGRYRGDALLGDEVFMNFEHGRASYRLPSNAHYPDKKGTK